MYMYTRVQEGLKRRKEEIKADYLWGMARDYSLNF